MTTPRALLSLLALTLSLGCADRDLVPSDDDVGDETGMIPMGDLYAACEEASECDAGLCLKPLDEPGFCTLPCQDSSACPEAPVGSATATCVEVGGDAVCALDCGSGRSCPGGMRCEQVEAGGAPRSICF